jgi:hypothetical protein
MPVQHAVQHASLGVAPWLVGKPTRTAGVRQRAEERKRRGSKSLLSKPSQASLWAGVFRSRCNQGAIRPGQAAVTCCSGMPLRCPGDLVTCDFSPA